MLAVLFLLLTVMVSVEGIAKYINCQIIIIEMALSKVCVLFDFLQLYLVIVIVRCTHQSMPILVTQSSELRGAVQCVQRIQRV